MILYHYSVYLLVGGFNVRRIFFSMNWSDAVRQYGSLLSAPLSTYSNTIYSSDNSSSSNNAPLEVVVKTTQ